MAYRRIDTLLGEANSFFLGRTSFQKGPSLQENKQEVIQVVSHVNICGNPPSVSRPLRG